MKTRLIRAFWLAIAAGGAAIVLGVAADRAARSVRLDSLIASADAGTRPSQAVARLRMVLASELARSRPDPEALAAATIAARALGREAKVLEQIASWAEVRLETELARARPREEPLRSTYEVLAACGSPVAADWLRRIAEHRPDLPHDIAVLETATAALRSTIGSPDGDAALIALGKRRHQLLGAAGTVWAERTQPPLARALAAADAAAWDHLARVIDPDRLRALWTVASAAGFTETLSSEHRAALASAMRRRELPLAGLAVIGGVLAILVGALALMTSLLRRGPRAIDPGAETIENVEPIDLDTDAETLARSTTGSGEDTATGAPPL